MLLLMLLVSFKLFAASMMEGFTDPEVRMWVSISPGVRKIPPSTYSSATPGASLTHTTGGFRKAAGLTGKRLFA